MQDDACLNCVLKHLSQAMIIHEEEVPMGYPGYIHRVMGHLAEASRESVKLYPDLANAIRSHRLALLDDRKHVIPYQGLLDYTEVLITCLDQNLPLPGVPEDLLVRDARPERPERSERPTT